MPEPTSIFPVEELDPNLRDKKGNITWPEGSFREFAQIMRACIDEDPAIRGIPTSDANQDIKPPMLRVVERLKLLLEENHRICTICMTSPPNAKLQCGHAILCPPCTLNLRNRGMGCPICNAPIRKVTLGMYTKTFVPQKGK